MSDDAKISCPHCGKKYLVTAEYLALNGGYETRCDRCQKKMFLPNSLADVRAVQGAAAPGTAAAEAPPSQPLVAPERGVWRNEGLVVVGPDAMMPARCLCCNEPVEEEGYLTAVTYNPKGGWGFIGNDVEPQVMLIEIFFCPKHRWRARLVTLGLLIGLGAVPLIATAGLLNSKSVLINLALLLPAAALFLTFLWFVFSGLGLRGEDYSNGYMWISGFGRAYVRSLPSLKAARAAAVKQMASRLEQTHE